LDVSDSLTQTLPALSRLMKDALVTFLGNAD
jgi:hypothetical protein